ncbi:MAG TPA: nickel-binding protein, partial [Methylophilaceae bacterium]|nr:nickel-binding protein [Methylophilaceae bacterium]
MGAVRHRQPAQCQHPLSQAGMGRLNHHPRRSMMPKYLIEREIPNAGALTPDELQGVAATSCGVLRDMGPQIQWVESY